MPHIFQTLRTALTRQKSQFHAAHFQSNTCSKCREKLHCHNLIACTPPLSVPPQTGNQPYSEMIVGPAGSDVLSLISGCVINSPV